MHIILHAAPGNDLHEILTAHGHTCVVVPDAGEALRRAQAEGLPVLSLARSYPSLDAPLPADELRAALDAGVRIYVEYPAALPGLELGPARPIKWQRVVVASDFFGPDLPPLSILALHGCWHRPCAAQAPHLVLARVAGYRRAALGLPAERRPILFEAEPGRLLVATTRLSHCLTARYAPTVAWQTLWRRILTWLNAEEELAPLTWRPTVRATYAQKDTLPANIESRAFHRCADWFDAHMVYHIDEKVGVFEGFEAHIDHNGRQWIRPWPRGDCIGESSLVFALDYALHDRPERRHTAEQMLDYVWSSPDFNQDDPHSPAYGLNNWAEHIPAFYGDDNARVIIPTLAASALLGETRWLDRALRCLLANLRTTGPNGFRPSRIDLYQFHEEKRGWRYYFEHDAPLAAPHYQATLWAAFLWAYQMTDYDLFRERAKLGLAATMRAYPNLPWTNGIVQEYAKLLWALAYLVRVEDTPEHRAWLSRVAGDLLAQMRPCGAIEERLGPLQLGKYPPPTTNEAYGTNEAPLIQENGDPCCDLLYSANFAFVALHEAAAATGNTDLRTAADRLAEFFCRIQVRSEQRPNLDGCWMRGFDFHLWEYWGSSADSGWGAWCVETGWTNAWIASILACRQLGQTIHRLDLRDELRARIGPLAREMFSDSPPAASLRPAAVRVPGAEQTGAPE